ncbi:unnamed protein product [Choristocarpus tenellus]
MLFSFDMPGVRRKHWLHRDKLKDRPPTEDFHSILEPMLHIEPLASASQSHPCELACSTQHFAVCGDWMVSRTDSLREENWISSTPCCSSSKEVTGEENDWKDKESNCWLSDEENDEGFSFVMSSAWAERFRNSKPVQRCLRRLGGKNRKHPGERDGKSGGNGKKKGRGAQSHTEDTDLICIVKPKPLHQCSEGEQGERIFRQLEQDAVRYACQHRHSTREGFRK